MHFFNPHFNHTFMSYYEIVRTTPGGTVKKPKK